MLRLRTFGGLSLESLAGDMAFPGWAGRNWDALEELLAHPKPSTAGGILIAWIVAPRSKPSDAD